MKNKFAKWKPYIFLAVLLASLVPLVWLGRYNYPTGDDYYYGTEAHLVWQQTGSIPQAISAACAGVAKSYQIWQGTYSALFLMYLAPNAFSNTAYHLVTFVILLLLCGGILCPICFDEAKIQLEDVVSELGLSSILIADAGLGTINSVVLTAEYMKAHHLPLKGIIFNHYHPGDVMEDDNIFMCEYMTGLPTLAKVQDGDTELKMDVEALAGLYE